ncbi:MAG TPA: ORF6N domain-containing protein, partial [bacterium]|nr:ORF6N domain-containing protein [bacterium]
MTGNELIQIDEIKRRIFTIRGMQVMLDSDLAELYGVETKHLNRAVKRNIERFPESFMFQLAETENLRFQNGTSRQHGGRRYLPNAFTESGIAMLSAVLKSDVAIKVSVQIMEAFVAMRKFINQNAEVFFQINSVEKKLVDYKTETDKKLSFIFKTIEANELPAKQGIFFEGQIFEAHKFVSDIVRSAEKSIILIDNYVDDTVLTLFSKRKRGVALKILTKNLSKQLQLDTQKFNEQFPPAEIKEFSYSHDRFMIIDDCDLYHFGASLKDLGRKWFGFSKMDVEVAKMVT